VASRSRDIRWGFIRRDFHFDREFAARRRPAAACSLPGIAVRQRFDAICEGSGSTTSSPPMALMRSGIAASGAADKPVQPG
jgi:hypothetical protein